MDISKLTISYSEVYINIVLKVLDNLPKTASPVQGFKIKWFQLMEMNRDNFQGKVKQYQIKK